MLLPPPTAANINAHYNSYLCDESGYRPLNQMLTDICRAYPSHDDWKHVLIKATLINTLYKTGILDIRRMAEHISQGGIAANILTGDPAAVETIAPGHGIYHRKGSEYDFYSFASKYCHFHNKVAYPIYDRNVRLALIGYEKERTGRKKSRPVNWRDYPSFILELNSFRDHHQIRNVPPEILDKFLWMIGGRIYREQREAAA